MSLSKIALFAVAGSVVGTTAALAATQSGMPVDTDPTPISPTPILVPGCSGAGTDSCLQGCTTAAGGSYLVKSAGYYACSGPSCVSVSCTQRNFGGRGCKSTDEQAETSLSANGCK